MQIIQQGRSRRIAPTILGSIFFLLSLSTAWADDQAVLDLLNYEPPLPTVYFQERVALPHVEPFELTRTRVRHGLSCLPAVTLASSASDLLPWVSQVDLNYFTINVFNFGAPGIEPEVLVTYWCAN